MSISQDTGRLVVSASGGNEAFVIFGACTPNLLDKNINKTWRREK
jgi:hypothetical protein